MAIEVGWFDADQRAILWKFGERWTLHDYRDALQQSRLLVAGLTQFDCIADMSATQTTPPGFLAALRTEHKRVSPNYGMTVVVNANRLNRLLLTSLMKVPAAGNERYFFVKCLTEAVEILAGRCSPVAVQE
jgi:hypothetical protein